jgi:sulfite reductase (NADPH) flavoprotein alpha-component
MKRNDRTEATKLYPRSLLDQRNLMMNKKTLYKLHKWAGVSIGLFLFLLALSGTALTFREELLPKLYPHLFAVKAGKEILPAHQLYEGIRPVLGKDKKVTNLYASEDPEEAYIFLYQKPESAFPMMLTVNPYTGKVVGEMNMIKNVFSFMLFLHAYLFLGKTGSYVVGVLGIVLIFFIISGIIIWLSKKEVLDKFKKSFRFSEGRKVQKLHHTMGLLLSLPLFISAMTGFLTVYDLPYYIARPLKGEEVRVPELEAAGTCSWEEEVKMLKSLTPEVEQKLISIHFCTAKSSIMKVSHGLHDKDFLKGYARFIVDPKTLATLQTFNSESDPSSWNLKRLLVYPLHTGEFFGLIGRWIVLLGGIGLMILYATGLRLFFKRRRSSLRE